MSFTYDLEERTLCFAIKVAQWSKTLPRTISNTEYIKQIIRSSASIGANYLEANESLSKKDFIMRAKIARKEAKETVYWLNLIKETNSDSENRHCTSLINEAQELKKILSAILRDQ